jgi:hypothetical protein
LRIALVMCSSWPSISFRGSGWLRNRPAAPVPAYVAQRGGVRRRLRSPRSIRSRCGRPRSHRTRQLPRRPLPGVRAIRRFNIDRPPVPTRSRPRRDTSRLPGRSPRTPDRTSTGKGNRRRLGKVYVQSSRRRECPDCGGRAALPERRDRSIDSDESKVLLVDDSPLYA